MIDWGSVPDWLSGVGGIGALAAAVVAVVYSRKAFRLQRNQIDELSEDKLREQAAKIAAWAELRPTVELAGGRLTPRMYVGVLFNDSSVPIYGAIVRYFNSSAGEEWHLLSIVPPGQTSLYTRNDYVDWSVEIFFLDANGRYWHRNRLGNLLQITETMHRERAARSQEASTDSEEAPPL